MVDHPGPDDDATIGGELGGLRENAVRSHPNAERPLP
jgi:hypothetical protein